MHCLSTARKEVSGGQCLVFYYARRFLLEPDLKLMNKPVKSFLHNVNAYGPKVICKLVLIARSLISFVRYTARPEREWWSQTESNRRHPACKAGALPTELWPQNLGCKPDDKCVVLVGLGRLELPTLRLSGVRSNHLSYRPLGSATARYLRLAITVICHRTECSVVDD